MEVLNIDTISPVSKDSADNCYILVIIDCFARFVELYPVSDTFASFLYLVIPAMRDVLANLPTSALEGSKSSDELDGERFKAIRGTGSIAPGSADERNPRPSWLCVDKVPVGNKLPYKESGNSQEYQASDEVDKAPQQRAGPFPFETPRIPKSNGLRADPSPPYEPISTRKVQSLLIEIARDNQLTLGLAITCFSYFFQDFLIF